MGELTDLKCGWDFMAQILGADFGCQSAFSGFNQNLEQNNTIRVENLRIEKINAAIEQLKRNINEHPNLNLGVEQFKGFVAEEMHAATFNIDAIRKDSLNRAWTLQENGYGSVDIDTNFGKQYSLKYSNTAQSAENMQAALNPSTGTPKYEGQEQLIAAEQLEEAKQWAHRRRLKNIENRPELSTSHGYTEKHLVGKIGDGEGVESKELSIKEARKIAEEAKTGSFDPEKYGINKSVIQEKIRIDYVNQALKAGLTAATITMITQIVPELYKAIDYLIKHGEINLNGLKQSGKKVISSSGEAFLRGSIAYGIEMSLQNGLLGETVKTINPSVVGVAVTIIFGTVKDSILVAAGKMSAKDMGSHFVDSIIVSSGYLVGMKIGGTIAQALFPQVPGIAYAIGSLLGCSIAVAYNIGKKKLISFCINTGFTCFGLVEQNYEIPDEVLAGMGIQTIPIPRSEIETVPIARVNTDVNGDTIEYETIDISVLKRGIIGVNKVGYVLA